MPKLRSGKIRGAKFERGQGRSVEEQNFGNFIGFHKTSETIDFTCFTNIYSIIVAINNNARAHTRTNGSPDIIDRFVSGL